MRVYLRAVVEVQRPKPEFRNPKEGRRPKPKSMSVAVFFRIRPSDFFRTSDFGLRISILELTFICAVPHKHPGAPAWCDGPATVLEVSASAHATESNSRCCQTPPNRRWWPARHSPSSVPVTRRFPAG